MENQAAVYPLHIGQIIYLNHIHANRGESVILRGEVMEIDGDEFKAKLIDNNGFQKDGWSFVFNKECLLPDQNFTDFESLGVWYDEK